MANQSDNSQKKRKTRYIVSITQEDSYKQRGFKITKMMFYIVISATVIILMAGTYFLTSRTFIKYTIPGYPNAETKQLMIDNAMKVDSLQRVIDTWSFQVTNIQRIITGQEPLSIEIDTSSTNISIDGDAKAQYSEADSIFRENVTTREQFNITHNKIKIEQIEGMHFFTPLKGIITNGYNLATNHPYIDIAAQTGTMVYAVLDGTVIASYWNDDTGYVIQIQHSNDLVSIYKHNEQLLKKVGDKVTAGTPIAFVGNTGRLSTGPHLHFELWHKGESIDPTLYINF